MKEIKTKYLIIIYLLISNHYVSGQENFSSIKIFFQDTVGEFKEYGQIEPTDIITTDDSSYIVSTQKRIYFKEYHERFNEFDYDFSNKIFSKEKINSSIVKLDANFDTIWEIDFDDRYVKSIIKDKSNNIYVSGSLITENKIWIGKVSLSGKILWKKDYKVGANKISYLTNVIKMTTNQYGDIIILGNKCKLSFVSIYGNRIKFFKENLSDKPFIAMFDSIGNKKWFTVIKNEDKSLYANDISVNKVNNIVISSQYIYNENDWGSLIAMIDKKGKIIWKKLLEKKRFYINADNDFIICTGFDGNSICLQQYDLQGNFLNSKEITKYISNRQFFSEWSDNYEVGLIWLQNNKKFLVYLENEKLNWEEINIPTEYIQLKSITKSLEDNIIFIGYRYYNPTNKPLDLVKYIEIIEKK